MYSFKVINMNISEKIFNESCFYAVSDAKSRLGSYAYIPTKLEEGIFTCNGGTNENLEIMVSLRNYLQDKRFVEGIDFTINVLMEN